MDRIAAILRFQWRAYWRRFRRAGNISANNVGVLVLFAGIAVFRYLQQLPAIAAQLSRSETSRYETALTIVFVVWMLPVLGESSRSIMSRDLLHTPLTSIELFLIRLGSVFISPVTWVIVAASLTLCYPISKASHPGTGIVALLLFVLFSLAISLTIAHVLSSGFMRKLLVGALFVLSVVLGGSWLLSGRILSAGPAWWPHKLAAQATVSSRPFGSLAALALLTIVAFGVSLWTFNGSLEPGEARRSQRLTILGLVEFPGRLGGLMKKDLRYFTRSLDLYLVLPIVIMLDIYLATAPDPSAPIFRAVLVFLFLPLFSLVSNCFGLDSPLGFDRYAPLPLSGRDILLSKNLAFASLVVLLFVAIFPFAFLRFDLGVIALGFIEVALMALAYLSWGNWMSVRDPYRMQFYRFSSGGSPIDAIMGLIFGSLPGLLMAYLIYSEGYAAIWKIAMITVVYVAAYYLSITRSGRRFEERREEIRSALFG